MQLIVSVSKINKLLLINLYPLILTGLSYIEYNTPPSIIDTVYLLKVIIFKYLNK